MPIFVIERQYLLPIYQHLVIQAPNLDAACKEAVEGEHDWEGAGGAAVIMPAGQRLAARNSCRQDLAEDIRARHIHLAEFLYKEAVSPDGALTGPALTIPPDHQTD